MDEFKTPENKVLQALFGPTISLKEIVITAAAVIIIGGFLGVL
jgi:hypothetical protein